MRQFRLLHQPLTQQLSQLASPQRLWSNYLLHPPKGLLEINNNDHLYFIEIYLALQNISQACYPKVCATIMHRHPAHKLLFYQVMLTSIIPIVNNMCAQSYVTFTGTYLHMDQCLKCEELWYDEVHTCAKNGGKKVACQQFYTNKRTGDFQGHCPWQSDLGRLCIW